MFISNSYYYFHYYYTHIHVHMLCTYTYTYTYIHTYVTLVMGIDGIINTIARILSPILMGDIYRRLGASMAFGVAGLAVLSSSAIALIRRFIVLRDQKKNF